jgi:integrase
VNGPTTWKRKADATAWLAAEETKLHSGVSPVDPRRSRITLGVYATQWLADRPLRDRTRNVYSSLLRVHILPEFETVALSGITTERVRAWHARLARAQPSMAPKAYRLLRTILTTGVEDGLLGENPCRVRGAGTERAAERRVPTVGEVQAVAAAIEDRYRVAVFLAAFCGLRRGEIFGLARRHLVLDGHHPVTVVERQRAELPGKGLVFTEPKTDASRRTVAVPRFLIAEIAAHLDRFVDDDPDALVVTGPNSKDTPRPSSWQPAWDRARRAAGVPTLRFHDLRHLAGTMSAQAGGTIKEIQARLGHATPDAAMHYQHVAEGRDEELADGIDRLIRRPRSKRRRPPEHGIS